MFGYENINEGHRKMLYMIRCENFLMRTLPCLLFLASLMFLIQIIYFNPMTYAVVNQDRYWSVISGVQQIPPVNTSAIGYAGFKFPDDMTWLLFTVNAENIGIVTGIYLYQNDKTQSGTIVLDLLKTEREHPTGDAKIVNITSEGKMTGTLSVSGAS